MTESAWLDFMVFELDEEGEKTRLNINKEDLGDYLKLESAFIIINLEIKIIPNFIAHTMRVFLSCQKSMNEKEYF